MISFALPHELFKSYNMLKEVDLFLGPNLERKDETGDFRLPLCCDHIPYTLFYRWSRLHGRYCSLALSELATYLNITRTINNTTACVSVLRVSPRSYERNLF